MTLGEGSAQIVSLGSVRRFLRKREPRRRKERQLPLRSEGGDRGASSSRATREKVRDSSGQKRTLSIGDWEGRGKDLVCHRKGNIREKKYTNNGSKKKNRMSRYLERQ